MKRLLSDFVALWILYKEDEETHSWLLIIAVFMFCAIIGYLVIIIV